MFALNLMQFCLAHDDIECITRTGRGGHDKIPKGRVRANHAPPKGADEGAVGYLGKSNRLYAVTFPSKNKADASDAMEIELLAQSVDGAESAEEIDQYLSDLEGLVENTDGSEGDPPEPVEIS